MTTLNIQLVKSEDEFSKNSRMILIIGIIIISTLIFMNEYSKYKTELFIPKNIINNPVKMPYMKSDYINVGLINSNIMAKTVILYNINKNNIPVKNIILVGAKLDLID